MAFPLVTVLSTAPSIISAAADILRTFRERHKAEQAVEPVAEKVDELEALVERQAEVIEELAISNRNLALAARNNRIIAGGAVLLATLSLLLHWLG